MPSVLPRISKQLAATLRQVPACTSRERSPSCRASAIELGDDQLGHAARVRERSVEHRHAVAVGGCQIDLIGADTEAPDGQQRRAFDDPRRHLGLGPDAEDVHAGQAPRELVGGQRVREGLDGETLGGEQIEGGLVDVLEEKGTHAGSVAGPKKPVLVLVLVIVLVLVGVPDP